MDKAGDPSQLLRGPVTHLFLWNLSLEKIEDGLRWLQRGVIKIPKTMEPTQITVKTLNGDHYVIPLEPSKTLHVKWLKEKMHEAEPTFTPFSQQIFTADIVGELSNDASLDDTEYLLLIHPDRAGVTLADYTLRYGEGFSRFTHDVLAHLPSAQRWENHIERWSDRSLVQDMCTKYHVKSLLKLTLEQHVLSCDGGSDRKVMMACMLVRTTVEEPWTKRVTLTYLTL